MIVSNVNFNLYKSFVAVYEARNISRAAAALQITQPTVTYNIKELERQLEVKLFHTHPRGVEPTKDAHELYKFVSEGMISIINGENKIREFTEKSALTLRISVASGPAQKYVAQAVESYSAKYPLVRFEFSDAWAEDAAVKLNQHNVELIVGFVAPELSSLEQVELKTMKRVVIMSKEFAIKHKLDGVELVARKQLEKLPAVVFQTSSKTYDKAAGDSPFATVSNFDMMLNLVKRGQGVGICTEEHLADQSAEGIVAVKLDGAVGDATMRCIYHKDAVTKPTTAFIEELCNIFNVDSPIVEKTESK